MQNPKDGGHQVKMASGVVPTNSAAATIASVGIDRMAQGSREGFDSAALLVQVGAASGTPDSFTVIFTLQDSADNSTFNDLDAATYAAAGLSAAAFTTITAAGVASYAVNLQPLRRYIGVKAVVAFVNGTSPKIPVSCCVALTGAHHTPPA